MFFQSISNGLRKEREKFVIFWQHFSFKKNTSQRSNNQTFDICYISIYKKFIMKNGNRKEKLSKLIDQVVKILKITVMRDSDTTVIKARLVDY